MTHRKVIAKFSKTRWDMPTGYVLLGIVLCSAQSICFNNFANTSLQGSGFISSKLYKFYCFY